MSRWASSWPIREDGCPVCGKRYGHFPECRRPGKFTVASDAEQRAAESLAATREGLRRWTEEPGWWPPNPSITWAAKLLLPYLERSPSPTWALNALRHIRDAWRELHGDFGRTGLVGVPLRPRAVDHGGPAP